MALSPELKNPNECIGIDPHVVLKNEEVICRLIQDALSKIKERRILANFSRILDQLLHFSASMENPEFTVHKDIIEAFFKIDKPVQDFLLKAIWIGCYKPDEVNFGGNLFQSHPRFLLNCKSEAGINIICQVIHYFMSCIELAKFQQEYKQLQENLKTANSPERQIEIFNGLPRKAKSMFLFILWYDEGGKYDPNFGG